MELPELNAALDLETQLKQARRIVCTLGKPDPLCAWLVDMSLRLAADPEADAEIRVEYAALREPQTV